MCAYALFIVEIGAVYFGCYNPRFGGNGTVLELNRGKYNSYGGF
jgi:tRNA(Arg) A34 adenosine deaminase TadA